MKVFRINANQGDAHWIVAESPSDVLAIVDALHLDGGAGPDEFDRTDIIEMPDHKVLNIDLDDGNGPTKKTCAEWVAAEGRGLLGSENW